MTTHRQRSASARTCWQWLPSRLGSRRSFGLVSELEKKIMEFPTSPGPWKFGYTDDLQTPIIIDANDDVVSVMHEGVTIKDGKLMAAAPSLLMAHEPEREGPDFLDWVADRLVHQHGESANADFILCLRRRA